jgi:hypothetical protein
MQSITSLYIAPSNPLLPAERVNAVVDALLSIAKRIQRKHSISANALYSELSGITVDQFNQCVTVLVRARLILASDGMLTWIGPQ